MNLRTFCAILATVCFAGFASHAQTSSAPAVNADAPSAPAVTADGGSAAYVLGRDDVIEVGLLGRTDFNGRARVQADGSIQLPFIGKVQVADRTTAEVSEAVRKALQAGGYFSDPVVTVEIVGYSSRYVTVLGSVGQPGLVPMNRPYRVSEVLARVGGVRDNAADYLVIRSVDGEERKLIIRDLATGGANEDPFVRPGDKIFSPVAETFYIYGQVNSPGAYPLNTDSTVRMAIAKAGGLTESGSDKKVNVTRGGKKVKVDLAAKIEPGDVLLVGERLF